MITTLSGPEKLLPMGTYSEQEKEDAAVNALVTKFREWAAAITPRISALHPYRDVYRNLLAMAGGENANRWIVELSYFQILHGDEDEPTANHSEEKLLPPGMDKNPLKRRYADDDSTEKLLPPGMDRPQESESEADNQ